MNVLSPRNRAVVNFLLLLLTVLFPAFAKGQALVQLNAKLPSSGAQVAAAYASAQTAGNLNVVIVGWSDSTATVSTVTDTKGNVYTLAVGPIVVPGAVSQSIYYAKNIAGAVAGGNTVTVKFSTTASYPDVRILEYSGLDVNNPLDGGMGAVGSATTSDSGALVTTNGNDLLIGANTVLTSTTAAGTGYTNRMITDPDGDLVEDKVVTAVGTYHATATLSSGGSWVMEVVAFKAAGAAPAPTAPGNLVATPVSTAQINLTWTASTETGGTVSSYLVERCVGAGCTNFAQVGTSGVTSYSDTGLASGTSYSYRVRGQDTANSVGPYSNTATGITQGTAVPTAPGNLTGVAGASGPVVVATQGYINATSQPTHTTNAFDSTGGDLLVICVSSHGGVTMTPSDSYGNSWILGSGPTSTTVGFDLRTGVWYARNPTVGAGHTVTVNLSAAQPVVISVIVVKGSNIALPIDGISSIGSDGGTETESVSSPSITTTTGYDLLIGYAKSSINEVWTAGAGYTAQPTASSAYLDAETGQAVTPGSYAATFGINGAATWQAVVVGVSPSAAAASPSQVNLTWTASTETGGTISSYLVERCQGTGCTSFTQIGTSTNTIFNDTNVSPGTTYIYRVRAVDTFNDVGPYSNTASVTMPGSTPPSITSLSPTSGQIGTVVTISGTNFGTSQGTSTVTLNGISATPTNWSPTSIVVSVPVAATGNVVVTLGGVGSNGVNFTVTPPTAPTNLSASVPVPSSTEIDLSFTASTDTGGVANYLLERCQGVGCTNFVQLPPLPGNSFPLFLEVGLSPATSYSFRLRATDAAGNLSGYSNIASATTPFGATITSELPSSGPVGTLVTLTGTSFGPTQGASTVTFNGTAATPTSWKDTAITVSVPVGATSGLVFVNVGGVASNPFIFTITPSPMITSLNPTSGPVGTLVVIGGNNFGSTQGTSTVNFNGTPGTPTSWTATAIAVAVPAGATTGNLVVTVGGLVSNGMSFTVTALTPTAPTNLAATAASSTQINLSWTASTETGGSITSYLIERCQTSACSNFVQVGTSTTTTFGDTGLTGSTFYSYRVRAMDAASNLGPYSATATTSTPPAAPSAPTNLTASAASSTQVNLSWTASTEAGGTISQYLVERCQGASCTNFAQIGFSVSTVYNDSGLIASTVYQYRLRAQDTINTLGPYSNTAAATTAAPVITAPQSLVATAASATQINLSWTAATETGGTISSYLVERCQGASCSSFSQIGTSSTTTFSNTGLLGATSYSYRVRATDAANNLGPYSLTATATTSAPIITAPASLTATAASTTQINLSWTAATETGGTLSNYLVESCQGVGCTSFTQISTSATLTFSNTGLTGSTSYSYRVRATDALGNLGPYSSVATASTPAATPTAPTNLTATAASNVQINLSWTASTETGGTIATYLVERCQGSSCTNFVQVGTSTTNTFASVGLTGSTTYRFRVRAQDALNNIGPYSSIAVATTPVPTITAPASLTATAVSAVQINLSWAAATETGGTISNYLVERCQGVSCTTFAQIGTSAALTFNNTGLTGSTSYSYRVRATDAAGDLGAYSTTATALTAAPTITAPSNLKATAASNTQINLSWTAASETGGTINTYLVERCQGASCTNFTQVGTSTTTSLNDTGLTASTSYSYRVRARDAANNVGPYSNTASATTLASAPPPPTINLAQLNAGLPSSGATVSVAYASAQTAGNLNVVIVGWSDSTATVSTVTDTKGNVYTLAVGPIVVPGAVSQSIYYAKNIAGAVAGGNTVTVKFSTTASYPDVRILEYSGLDVNNPLDGGMGAVGSATTSDSGALVTTNANDLLVGANTVLTGNRTAGAGYTSRMITDPDGDLVEDKVVTAVGTYHATATLSSGGSWVMEVVAFKAAGAAPAPTAPGNLVATPVSTAQINLTWTASTETGGTVSSYLVERCVGAGCTNFAQVGTSGVTSYSDTGLASGTSYSYRVRGQDTANSVGPYSNTATGITQGTAVPTAPGNLTGVAGASGPVVVATQGYINATSQPTHTTNAFDSTGGDLLVICVSSHGGVTMTPSDSYGNSWILGSGPTSTTVGFDLRTGVWYARNPTVGAGHTVTVNLSAAQPVVISVIVVKGSNIALPIDGISSIGSDGGTETESVSSPSITTTTGYDLLIGYAKSSINEVWTAGAGYTAQPTASSAYLDAETGQAVTPGSYAATFGINGAATWQAVVVGVSPSAAAASPSQVNLTWTASTETGGTISSYLVERCQGTGCTSFTQIGTSTAITFNDSTVSPGTTYVYRVRAKDISNALGPYSATAAVTMP